MGPIREFMCLDEITMQCQLSNVRITVSGLMGHNIFLEALCLMLFSVFWEVANCWVNIRVKAKCECTKKTIDYQCAVETMESHKLLENIISAIGFDFDKNFGKWSSCLGHFYLARIQYKHDNFSWNRKLRNLPWFCLI